MLRIVNNVQVPWIVMHSKIFTVDIPKALALVMYKEASAVTLNLFTGFVYWISW